MDEWVIRGEEREGQAATMMGVKGRRKDKQGGKASLDGNREGVTLQLNEWRQT
jgi:hypothetical protein